MRERRGEKRERWSESLVYALVKKCIASLEGRLEGHGFLIGLKVSERSVFVFL